jgi:hypothetical protein
MKPKKKHAFLVPIPQKPQEPRAILVPKQFRQRQTFHFTLSDVAYAALKKLARRFHEPMSRTLDRLILTATEHLLDQTKTKHQAADDAIEAIKQLDRSIRIGSKGKAKPIRAVLVPKRSV